MLTFSMLNSMLPFLTLKSCRRYCFDVNIFEVDITVVDINCFSLCLSIQSKEFLLNVISHNFIRHRKPRRISNKYQFFLYTSLFSGHRCTSFSYTLILTGNKFKNYPQFLVRTSKSLFYSKNEVLNSIIQYNLCITGNDLVPQSHQSTPIYGLRSYEM